MPPLLWLLPLLTPNTASEQRATRDAKPFDDYLASMAECTEYLLANGQRVFGTDNDTLWCNAIWDTILCWEATRAGDTASQPCPKMKGLDTSKSVVRVCDAEGAWTHRVAAADRGVDVVGVSVGSSDYIGDCAVMSPQVYEHIVKQCAASGRWADVNGTDFGEPHTDFGSCYDDEFAKWMEIIGGDGDNVKAAQNIAKIARKIEYVGVFCSFTALVLSILIFVSFRRLRVFRIQLHLQLFVAILGMVTVRIIIYMDLATVNLLNNTLYVCEALYLLLEYFKTVAIMWAILEGFYLYNLVVYAFNRTEPNMRVYLAVGYLVPLVQVLLWVAVMAISGQGGLYDTCLGMYYLHYIFYVIDGQRMAGLCLNLFFVANVIFVLALKVRANAAGGESETLKKSVKAALMLIPLLGLPNITQFITFTPTEDKIVWFAVFTYFCSFIYQFQGLLIATLYCFTNKEILQVVQAHYKRWKLTHIGADDLRRGSRANNSVHYTARQSHPTITRDSMMVEQPNEKHHNTDHEESVALLTGNGALPDGNGALSDGTGALSDGTAAELLSDMTPVTVVAI